METAGINLSKDPCKEEVFLQIISEKIKELNTLQAVRIDDNPVSERFLNIIANLKLSQFRTIFPVVPNRSNKKYINVKTLFRTTVALRRQDLNLPKIFWFLDSFQLGSSKEHEYVLAAKREKEEQDADHANNNYKPPSTTGQPAAVTIPPKPTSTTKGKAKKVGHSALTPSSTFQQVVTPTSSTTSAEARMLTIANANKALQDSYTYRYYSNYGNFQATKHRQKGPYSTAVYANQVGYSLYKSNDKKQRKKTIEEGLAQFDTFFRKEMGFSVSSNSATSPIIAKFIGNLLSNEDNSKLTLVQRTMVQVFRFSHTSPKRFANHWIYDCGALVDCPAARVWLAANKILGARWSLVHPLKLGPAPPPPIIQQKGVKPAPLPRGILRQKQSTTISSPFGQFCFHESTNKKPMIAEDHTQSKAPRN